MCRHQSGIAKHAVAAGGADGDDVGVEHHEGESPVAFERVPGMEVEDGFLLPVFEPPIAGDQGVVLVGQAVAGAPVVELAGGESQPGDESPGGDLGTLGPAGDVVDDGVTDVVGNPGPGQSSPSSFFSWLCSSINSATTSSARGACPASRGDGPQAPARPTRPRRSNAVAPSSKNRFCQA